MARLVLCVLALVASGLCIPEPAPSVEQQHTVVGKYFVRLHFFNRYFYKKYDLKVSEDFKR